MIEIEKEDEIYPKKLLNIQGKPKQLYVEGNIDLLNSIGIAVIGTRHPSDYGKRMCKSFTKELTQYGITIVSGMAEGIDTIAHKACLENGGKTIAVLPCGFNNIFPKQNERLFRDIIRLDGTVITEYPPNEKPESKKFLKRNRIVAGLGIGTLVIEAGYRSGTSVTARITKKQEKPVFCIPSSLENKHGITCNKIIQEGGKLVTCVEDILEEFKDITFLKKEIENTNAPVGKEYQEIYKILDKKPQHINQIAKRLNIKISEASYKLMILELDEYVTQLPGKYYIRK